MPRNETGTITLRLLAQDLASGNVGKFLGHIDAIAKKGGLMGSVLQGVGQSFGQMLNPMALASKGIGMVTDLLTDATKAAIEDERSLSQLHATLDANVGGWGQYAGAIEDAEEQALALAFADDEVRASLNLLLPRTKDVTEALKLNALAMDLARARNMSLEEAAGLVGKAYSGQATALKRAGFAIDDTADSARVLAQLQEQVAGQAQAYAETAEGSFKTLELTLGELVEQVGYELLPFLKELADTIRRDVIPNIDDMVHSLRDSLNWIGLASALARQDWVEALKIVQQLTDTEMRTLRVPPPGTIKFFDAIPKAAAGAMDETRAEFRVLPRIVAQSLDALTGIVKGSLREANQEAKLGMADIQWSLKNPAKGEELARIYMRQIRKGTRARNKALDEANAAAYAKADEFVKRYTSRLADLRLQEFHVQVQMDFVTKQGSIPGLGSWNGVTYTNDGVTITPRAHGGPVTAGQTYVVGERQAELFTPTTNGYISPSVAGVGGVHVHFHGVVAAPSEAEAERLARVIAPAITRYQRRFAG